MKKHCTVEIKKNTVIKTASPDLMRIEVEKTRRAHKIGKDCGLFYVPEVLAFDEEKGCAVFERLYRVVPIHDAVPWGEQYKSVAEKLGKAIAIIHNNLTLPPHMIIPLPENLQLLGNEVFLHGDLSVYNVCIDKSSLDISILDWQMTSVFGGSATFGTRYFDLLFFIGNLYNRPTINYLLNDPVIPVTAKFLNAYFKEADVTYESHKFSLYAENYFLLVKSWLKKNADWRRRPLLFRSNAMINNFKKLIPNLINNKHYCR